MRCEIVDLFLDRFLPIYILVVSLICNGNYWVYSENFFFFSILCTIRILYHRWRNHFFPQSGENGLRIPLSLVVPAIVFCVHRVAIFMHVHLSPMLPMFMGLLSQKNFYTPPTAISNFGYEHQRLSDPWCCSGLDYMLQAASEFSPWSCYNGCSSVHVLSVIARLLCFLSLALSRWVLYPYPLNGWSFLAGIFCRVGRMLPIIPTVILIHANDSQATRESNGSRISVLDIRRD